MSHLIPPDYEGNEFQEFQAWRREEASKDEFQRLSHKKSCMDDVTADSHRR